MIIRRILLWLRSATGDEREQIAGALARAFLTSRLQPEERREAEAAILSLLDDTSAAVRRALARELGAESEVPRQIILALARDQGDVAALVLARSPVLNACDLVECVETADALGQTAIAVRPDLELAVVCALAQAGGPDALVALAENASAALPEFVMQRMLERHGRVAALREALLTRPDLPATVRQKIATAVAEQLGTFAARRRWIGRERVERIIEETSERATLAIAADTPDETALAALVRQLRTDGRLTPRLLLRGLISGEPRLFTAALAELVELPVARVAALAADGRGRGREALLHRAGIPEALRPAFLAAWSAPITQAARSREARDDIRLSRPVLERVVGACSTSVPAGADALTALLRRFEAEAAREEARLTAARLAEDAALSMLIEADRVVIAERCGPPHRIAA